MNKLLFLITCVVLSTSLKAQNKPSFELSLNHISFCVKDVNQSVDFYKRVLKLQEITNRTKSDGIRWLSLGDGKELHLISTNKEPFKLNKAIHLGLTVSNLDAFVKNLEEQKIDFSDWPGTPKKITTRADGVKQIYLQDPDGYWIEVNDATN